LIARLRALAGAERLGGAHAPMLTFGEQ